MGNDSSRIIENGEQEGVGAQNPGETPGMAGHNSQAQSSGDYGLEFKTETQFQTFTYDTETSDFYGLLTLTAPEHADDNRPAIDVVCVLDVSGSMHGSKISLLRKSMRRLVRNLGSKDRCAFVTFDSDVKTLMDFTVMNADGKKRARDLVHELKPGSSTNLAGALSTGIELMKNSAQNEVTAVLLFTDGEANVGTTSVEGIVEEARMAMGMSRRPDNPRDWTVEHVNTWLHENSFGMYTTVFMDNGVDGEMLVGDITKDMLTQDLGVRTLHLAKFERELQKLRASTTRQGESEPNSHILVNTFGFGANHKATLLERIANTFDGMYFYMKDEDAIISGFANCLGGMLSTVAQDVSLVFQPADVQAFEIHKDDNTTTNDDGSVTVTFADLQSEEERHILASCTLPVLDEPDSDFVMFNTQITYTNLVTGREDVAMASCVLNRSGVEDGLNEHVDEAKNRVIATEAMAQAERLGDMNDFRGAQDHLSRAYEVINTSKSNNTEFCRNMIADLQNCQQRCTDNRTWQSEGRKYLSTNLNCHRMERAVNFDDQLFSSQAQYNTSSRVQTLGDFCEDDSDDSCYDDDDF